jgi:hypothetical protein
VDAGAGAILKCVEDICTLAYRVLKGWLAEADLHLNQLEADPPGPELLLDFENLRSMAVLDRLLWAWCLGRVPESQAAGVAIHVVQSKWRMPTNGTLTTADLSRVATQWADVRLPRLQTIVEAAGLEWLEVAPIARLRGALIRAAEQILCGSRESLTMSMEALSEEFHGLAHRLYSLSGIHYVRTHLHVDSIRTGDVPTFIAEIRGAFPFKESRVLLERHATATHGAIVRINTPITKRRLEAGASRWEGSLSYLEVR